MLNWQNERKYFHKLWLIPQFSTFQQTLIHKATGLGTPAALLLQQVYKQLKISGGTNSVYAAGIFFFFPMLGICCALSYFIKHGIRIIIFFNLLLKIFLQPLLI